MPDVEHRRSARLSRVWPSAECVASREETWRAFRERRENTYVRRKFLRRWLRRLCGFNEATMRRPMWFPPYRWAARNSLKVRLRRLPLEFDDLPPAFDGYTLLHVSDLHIDHVPGVAAAILHAVGDVRPDLLVFTGDLQDYERRDPGTTQQALTPVVETLKPRNGCLAVLGNHDSLSLVPCLEAIGIQVLINEIVALERGSDCIFFTGTDDTHFFRTDAAYEALAAPLAGFRIALMHSPEDADRAAVHHKLLLCGHTHGGQICLPGGRPIIKELRAHRDKARGLWREGRMQGYTTTGVGTSTIPLRLFCPAEVVLITLRHATQQPS